VNTATPAAVSRHARNKRRQDHHETVYQLVSQRIHRVPPGPARVYAQIVLWLLRRILNFTHWLNECAQCRREKKR
jgi:hypothetical protein